MKIININFDFLKWHKHAVYTSVFLILISLISIFTKGLNYGVDFNGGTIIEIGFTQEAPIEDIRNYLKNNNYKKLSVQYFGSDKDILIRMPNIVTADEATISNKLIDNLIEDLTFMDNKGYIPYNIIDNYNTLGKKDITIVFINKTHEFNKLVQDKLYLD